jgi:hypothetical protein
MNNTRGKSYILPANDSDDGLSEHFSEGSVMRIGGDKEEGKKVDEGLYPFLDSYRLRLPWYIYTPYILWFVGQNITLVPTYDFNWGKKICQHFMLQN